MPSYQKKVAIPGKTSQELYDVVSRDIDRFMEKSNLGKFDIQRDDAARTLSVETSMFSAKLFCKDGAMELDGKIGLMAMPFKGKIDEGIEKWLKKTFSA